MFVQRITFEITLHIDYMDDQMTRSDIGVLTNTKKLSKAALCDQRYGKAKIHF